jgi:hypothetical protein
VCPILPGATPQLRNGAVSFAIAIGDARHITFVASHAHAHAAQHSSHDMLREPAHADSLKFADPVRNFYRLLAQTEIEPGRCSNVVERQDIAGLSNGAQVPPGVDLV